MSRSVAENVQRALALAEILGARSCEGISARLCPVRTSVSRTQEAMAIVKRSPSPPRIGPLTLASKCPEMRCKYYVGLGSGRLGADP
ncbi:GD16359 [Drosophila simulans]|uniref:GD16359 n=1 Tax=Drosophila simulans TaxID=7240 RepID=B4QT83_DROSI|nr:GD16359 [Drosophila simulans]